MKQISFSRHLFPGLFIAAGFGVMYASFNWAISAVIHNRNTVLVPNISGKTIHEALNILSQSKLGLLKEGEQFDRKLTAGMVVRQNPPAGMLVREGRMIRIIVSQGGETLFVPDVLGQPMRQAQTLLQNVGLSIGEVETKPSLRFEKDAVMASDPPSGAVVSKNALVNLTVSAGAPGADLLLMPDFVGRSANEAKTWAASHQIQVSVREDTDPSKALGDILMQSPVADTPLRPGDVLTLVVNSAAGTAVDQLPHVRFDVPGEGTDDRDVRVVVIDQAGEREVYRKAQAPGSSLDVAVAVKGPARARIFVNGIMIEQQDLR